MMRLLSRLATLAALAVGLTMSGGRAEAAALPAPSGLKIAIDATTLNAETVQYFWGGHRYCWYDDGWQGPGWYWCGYAWNRGFGWGGGGGWHGWGRGGFRGGFRGGRGGFRGGFRGGRGGFRGGRGGFRGGRGGGGFRGGRGGGRGGARRSDINSKHDIVLLGHLANGLGFYRFAYNGSDKAYVGVIAQEVQAIKPEAVVRGRDGYLRVYYDQLGFHMQTWKHWVASGRKIPAVHVSMQ